VRVATATAAGTGQAVAEPALGRQLPGPSRPRAEAGRVEGLGGDGDGRGGSLRGVRRRRGRGGDGPRRGGLRRGARRAAAQGGPVLRLAPARRVELRGRVGRARAGPPPVQGAAAPRRAGAAGDRRQGGAAGAVGGAPLTETD